MRRLIVNADDFGLTSGVNRAIIKGNQSGIVTSATLMANAKATDAAIDLAMAQPGLKTGCHVVLIDGVPLTANLSSLAENSQRFRTSLKQFALAAIRKQIAAEEIQREVEAQIRKLQSHGITLTHLDSHKHTHMFPHILRPLVRAAKGCGIRAVRNPFEPIRCWPGGMVFGSPGLWLRSAGVMTFQLFAAEFRRVVKQEGIISTDGTVGIAVTGLLDQQKLLQILEALPTGTWELVCHPGYSDSDLQAAGTRLTKSREIELSALISADTRKALAHYQIELISYADL